MIVNVLVMLPTYNVQTKGCGGWALQRKTLGVTDIRRFGFCHFQNCVSNCSSSLIAFPLQCFLFRPILLDFATAMFQIPQPDSIGHVPTTQQVHI